MTRLWTPLVSGTVLAVVALAVVRLVLDPESWLTSAVALLFFPAAIGLLVLRSRSQSPGGSGSSVTVPGKLRAGLVGAGVLLATSLLLSILEHLGYVTPDADGGSAWVAIVAGVVAVAVDYFGAWLQKRAERDRD